VELMAAKSKKGGINYLELTPFVNYTHEVREDGFINVLVPKFTNTLLKKTITPLLKNPFIRANLDEFGSAVWLAIDGKTKVEVIADRMIDAFGERIQPAYERITLFLTQLYNAGFINFLEFKKGKNK
jgi:hypothetical protein